MVRELDNAYIALADNPDQRLMFQVFPESIQESKTADYVAIDIPGRSEPYRVYRSSSATTWPLSLTFVASVDQNDGGNPHEVWGKVAFLRSLVYPQVSDGVSIGPPKIFFRVGSFIDAVCIVKSFSVRWRGPWQIEAAEIDLDLPRADDDLFKTKSFWDKVGDFVGKIPSFLGADINPTQSYGSVAEQENIRRQIDLAPPPTIVGPMIAEVDLVIEEVNAEPLSSQEIRGQFDQSSSGRRTPSRGGRDF